MNVGVCAPRTWTRVVPPSSSNVTARISFFPSACARVGASAAIARASGGDPGLGMGHEHDDSSSGGQTSGVASRKTPNPRSAAWQRKFSPDAGRRSQIFDQFFRGSSTAGATAPSGAGAVGGAITGTPDPRSDLGRRRLRAHGRLVRVQRHRVLSLARASQSRSGSITNVTYPVPMSFTTAFSLPTQSLRLMMWPRLPGVHHQHLALRALRDDADEPQVRVAVVRRDELLRMQAVRRLDDFGLRAAAAEHAGLEQHERQERIAVDRLPDRSDRWRSRVSRN